MKMLVPVDGSSASIDVVKKAINIAQKFDLSIKLITIVPSDSVRKFKRNEQLWRQVDGSIISNHNTSFSDEKIMNRLLEDAEETLNSIKNELDLGSVALECEVLIGEPYEKIIELSRNENFDLILMSNRGFSTIKNFFLGSVTQRVAAESICPVMIIHADADADE